MDKNEGRIHQDCYVWFHNSFPQLRGLLCYNLNNSRDRIEGAKNRSKGVQPGRSDFVIYYQREAFMIEMKEGDGSLSKDQKDWQKLVESQGFRYTLCRTLEDFKEAIGGIINKQEVLSTKTEE